MVRHVEFAVRYESSIITAKIALQIAAEEPHGADA